MAQKRRVYIIQYSEEPVKQDVLSNMSKIKDKVDIDLSYDALVSRLHRAKNRPGKKQRIHLKDKNGQPLIIEVREIE